MTVTLLPDAEQIVSTYLRSRAEIVALVSDRVYTELPKKDARTFPLVRLVRVGGGKVTRGRWLDAPLVQIDAYGGSKYEARTIVATVAAVLDEITGYSAHGGVAMGATTGAERYVPDETFDPAKPRYVLDVSLSIHPSAA